MNAIFSKISCNAQKQKTKTWFLYPNNGLSKAHINIYNARKNFHNHRWLRLSFQSLLRSASFSYHNRYANRLCVCLSKYGSQVQPLPILEHNSIVVQKGMVTFIIMSLTWGMDKKKFKEWSSFPTDAKIYINFIDFTRNKKIFSTFSLWG